MSFIIMTCTPDTYGSSERRPVDGNSRVPPDDLVVHRLTHNFLGPGCLCPLGTDEPRSFVEASIFCVQTGRLVGEWVAACATGNCRFFGEYLLVFSPFQLLIVT